MPTLRRGTALATSKLFLSSHSGVRLFFRTHYSRAEKHAVVGQRRKALGAPADTVTVQLAVNFTGSQGSLSHELQILTFHRKKKNTQQKNPQQRNMLDAAGTAVRNKYRRQLFPCKLTY